MIRSIFLLCVAGSLGAVHAGPIRKNGKIEDKAASQEEVNVLMFGVIQLSESLNHVYESMEGKIGKIRQTLKRHEGTLLKLGKQAEQAAEVEKQIKEVIPLLKAQVATQQAQTQMMKDRLNGIEKDEVQLKTKVKTLEMSLNNFVPTSLKELQERAEEHSDVLQGLLLLTQFQKENIETQNEELSKLQMMSEAMA
ncbi:uncharacterized protein angptl8 [Odontesthes bonariensis]|uniref:uncharacterized protein angptl8 n=1 Tax=Odontesthes bonariensis TaxID=219752 RepID=UPI003F589DDF